MAHEAEWDWGHSDLKKKKMEQDTKIIMSGDGLWEGGYKKSK